MWMAVYLINKAQLKDLLVIAHVNKRKYSKCFVQWMFDNNLSDIYYHRVR